MKITVIGLGYVGSVAASGLAAAGHEVLGIDVDRQRLKSLRAGQAPIYEPGLEERLSTGVRGGNLRFLHPDDVDESLGDAAVIATGTPPSRTGGADLGQVRAAVDWLAAKRPNGLVLVMKSTVPPGTGRRLMDGGLRELGLRYASNPEFLREGRALADWDSPDRIVIGVEQGDDRAVDVVEKMHARIDAPRMITDVTSAEMVKYASNAFLATRISFINEIAQLCERVGASIDDVSLGMAMDERTGARIHAGVGYGGSCFPKDVRALDYLALTSGLNLDLLRSVINVNNRQQILPLQAIRDRFNGELAGLRVCVLGLAFKPETDDVRAAPSITLIYALVEEGVVVTAYDPQANETARLQLPSEVRIVGSPAEAARDARAAVLMTEWPQLVKTDWATLASIMLPPKFLFDGRNALDASAMRGLGFEYVGVGRA